MGETGEKGGGTPLLMLGRLLLMGVALAAAFSFAFTPLRASQDEWWHLKAGKWMVENRALPRHDIFTYTGEQTVWHNHEWLSQIAMYGVYAGAEGTALGGVRGLILAKALLFVAAIALVGAGALRMSGHWAAAALAALVCAEISRRTIYPRPPVVSYVLFALVLLLLHEWKAGRMRFRWLWLLVPLTVLWANLHGMCLLAVVATGAYAAGEVVGWVRARMRREEGASLRGVIMTSALTLACALAVMVNPSGWEIYFLGGKFMDDPYLSKAIAEMLPPPFFVARGASGWQFVPGFATYWIVLGVVGVLLVWNRLRLPHVASFLLLAFFAYQSVRHWRLLPLFGIAAAGPLAWLLAERARALAAPGRRVLAGGLAALTVLLAAWYVGGVGEPPPQTFLRRNAMLTKGYAADPASYPAPLMDFIIEAGLPDRMFSELNYCGYTIWRLSPEHHKLFTDNRFDIWGSEHYVDHEVVRLGAEPEESPTGEGWAEILSAHGVNFVVIARDAPVAAKLRDSADWTPIYYHFPPLTAGHPGYAVWLRRSPETAEAAERAAKIFATRHPGEPAPEALERGGAIRP